MKRRWNTQSTLGNGSDSNPLPLREKGYDTDLVANTVGNNNQTLRQYIKRFHRDKIIFLVGQYELHIYKDRACHNLLGKDVWTEVPMHYEIYVNDNSRFVQVTAPNTEKGDKIDFIFEYAGSIMI